MTVSSHMAFFLKGGVLSNGSDGARAVFGDVCARGVVREAVEAIRWRDNHRLQGALRLFTGPIDRVKRDQMRSFVARRSGL